MGQIIHQTNNISYSLGEHQINIAFNKSESKEILFITLIFDDKFYPTQRLLRK